MKPEIINVSGKECYLFARSASQFDMLTTSQFDMLTTSRGYGFDFVGHFVIFMFCCMFSDGFSTKKGCNDAAI